MNLRNSQIQDNLKKLAQIKEKNPSASHIYMRRDKDGVVVDIPVAQAEFTIKMRPTWDVIASNKQMDDEVEKLFNEPTAEASVGSVATIPPPDEKHNDPWKKKPGFDAGPGGVPPIAATEDDVTIPPKPSEIKRRTKTKAK